MSLRVLATSSLARLTNYPQVPTIAETFPGVEYIGWFALAAPARTPDEVVTRLNRELGMILERPQITAKLADLGFFTYALEPPAAVRARVQAQYELWGRLTRDIGLEPE
jgi:tripartite-type tricarboxylate transporter receptor subunit TctC